MTKNEFKIGDTVRLKGKKTIHTITAINEYGQYKVSGYSLFRVFSAKQLEHVKLPDCKTTFFTELQALLRKYDATIAINPCYDYSVVLSLYIDGKAVIREKVVENITADNIMEFDKE